MNVLIIILSVINILICAGLVVLVMMQDSNDRGMGTLGGGSNDSFYSNNMGRTKDVLMRRLTVGLGIAFVLLTIIISRLLG